MRPREVRYVTLEVRWNSAVQFEQAPVKVRPVHILPLMTMAVPHAATFDNSLIDGELRTERALEKLCNQSVESPELSLDLDHPIGLATQARSAIPLHTKNIHHKDLNLWLAFTVILEHARSVSPFPDDSLTTTWYLLQLNPKSYSQ